MIGDDFVARHWLGRDGALNSHRELISLQGDTMVICLMRRSARAACLVGLVAGPLHAQTNPQPQIQVAPAAEASAQGNSTSVVRSGTYYEDHAAITDCGAGFLNCILNFAVTPSDKFLTITNVACSNTSKGVPVVNYLYVSGLTRRLVLPLAPTTYGTVAFNPAASYNLNFNIVTNFKIGVSKNVGINFFQGGSGTPFSVDCTITGTLSDPGT